MFKFFFLSEILFSLLIFLQIFFTEKTIKLSKASSFKRMISSQKTRLALDFHKKESNFTYSQELLLQALLTSKHILCLINSKSLYPNWPGLMPVPRGFIN